MRKLTTEQFIQKAKEVHGDKYDYSLVVFVNTRTKITIICKEHGIFEQRPDNHLTSTFQTTTLVLSLMVNNILKYVNLVTTKLKTP